MFVMDQENLFSRLRRLANKVENESNLFQERMQKPPDQRVASGVSADNILKEMQYDIHKLKNDANKDLIKQQRENSLQDVLTACENLIRVNQRQASSLKEHLIQYGYQPATQQTKQTTRKKSSSEDKENTKQENAGKTTDDEMQEHPVNQRPITPPKVETSITTGDGDKTPTMEDFGLSMNRVNLFLKKDVPTSSRKVLDISDSDRYTPLEATAVYQQSGNLNFEDSELSLYSEPQSPSLSFRKQHTPIAQTLFMKKHGQKQDQLFRSESVEPKSPSLTSLFLQEPSKLPVQPAMSLQAATCTSTTPPTPDCQAATERVSEMPQEPKRMMVHTLERAEEPQEPDQHYPKVENITPELPPSLSDSAYRSKLSSQNYMTTPVHNKNIPSRLAFLQDEGTPKTPELTMSLNQMRCRPIPSVQPTGPPVSQVHGRYGTGPPVSQVQGTYGSNLQTSSTQRMVVPQSNSHSLHLAPITEQEFSTLSSKMKQNLSIEMVNSWIKVLDNYLIEKPLGEKILTSDDMEVLQGYPWLRATLMLMVNFQRMERIADGEDDVIFIPTAVP